MGDAQDNFGNASELIRQGLMRAGAPRDTPQMPHGNPGGGEYFGHDRSTAEQMIREGLRASAVASTQPLSNDDERAAQIGQRLIDASNERIDQQRPRAGIDGAGEVSRGLHPRWSPCRASSRGKLPRRPRKRPSRK